MTLSRSGFTGPLGLLHLVLSLSLALVPRGAVAKMEFPPKLASEKSRAEYVDWIRQELPEVFRSNSHAIDGPNRTYLTEVIQAEQELIARLKADHEYMRLAEERPSPKTLKVREVQLTQTRGLGVSASWNEFVTRVGVDASSSPEQTRSRLDGLLEQWAERSVSGFFSGWATLLEKSDRAALKVPDFRRRWAEIKERLSQRDISELRDKFQAAKFGITKANWTWSDLDKAFDELLVLEDQIAVLVQHLNPKASAHGEVWFLADELEDWSNSLDVGGPLKRKIEGLRDRLTREFSDPNAVLTQEISKRTLVLREIPPYMAIYRGCVGSDCSTTASWAFPYAPRERDWWVENEEGKRLGYVSGAITQVAGRDCLYIRDITGPGLDPAHIPFILYGFYRALPYYGVDQMTIMPIDFTGQNHFAGQVVELKNFGHNFTKNVMQIFPDQWIRENYLGNLTYSSNSYDGIPAHTTVRRIMPPPEQIANFRADLVEGTGSPTEARLNPKENTEKFFVLLHQALNVNNPILLENQVDLQADWAAVLTVLRNDDRKTVEEYRQAVEREFEKAQIPFSRNLLKKNEALFLQGFLAAPDAFEGENVRQAARYVTDILWRNKGSNQTALNLIGDNLGTLEESDIMSRNVKSLFERRQPEDLNRLNILWEAGYRFLHVDLSGEDLLWLASAASRPEMVHWTVERLRAGNLDVAALGAPVADALARMLENGDTSIDENISIEAARLFHDLPGLMNRSDFAIREVQQSLESEDNPEIGIPLARAYLRDVGRQVHPDSTKAADKWLESECERALNGSRGTRK